MEIKLQEIIEQIKKDGVQVAETEAQAIVTAAKDEAEKILADAKEQADKILADAKSETERMETSSNEAIRQAGRNLLISFRESVAKELKAIVGEKVTAAYSSDLFEQLIIKVVTGLANNPETEEITVLLNSDDLKSLEDNLLAALKEKISKGVTLRANDDFDKGFRIAVNDTGAFYDYSAEAVVDMLSNYLSPKVTELLKEA